MRDLDLRDFPVEHRVISEAEAARHCGLSVAHFRRLRKTEKGPRYVQLGIRRVGYRVGDLLAWLEERTSTFA